MDRGFFRSREFLVASLVGLLVVGGWAAALSYQAWQGPSLDRTSCDTEAFPGAAITPQVEESTTPAGLSTAQLEQRYVLPLGALQGGRADLCSEVGDLTITASPDDQIHLTVFTRATGPQADALLREARVEVAFTQENGLLHLASRQRQGLDAWGFMAFVSHGLEVEMVLQVPAAAGFNLSTRTDVGDVTLSDVTLGHLLVRTDVGDVTTRNVSLLGPTDVVTDVGTVSLDYPQVTGAIGVTTDVGEVRLLLPRDDRFGYHATLRTDVGSTTADLGPTSVHREEEDGASHRLEVRTANWESAPTKVPIVVVTDVGDITLATRNPT
ncbi:MAG TPA: DUF4097 family beta strand repeat-containing protein [Candidatus Thermoplasmatota archaeon]|nr:DUF4097 family beta strand repeat-containing protein [Candidatus Thermoplasmatota archaeon]